MSAPAPVSYTRDAEGVGWIIFDDPAAKANILNPATQAALEAALAAAERDAPRGLVIRSAKERIFIAGADLGVLAALPDAAAATELSRRGQRLFQRLADFPAPVVCAIHGACAGGGFELALACHRRIASDAAATRIGLPETGIGTIPGWGGSVRLPRLIGVRPALDHILKGQLIPAADALRTGLVDEVVPAGELQGRAKAAVLKWSGRGDETRATHPEAHTAGLATSTPSSLAELRETTRARTRGHQPALLAAIDAVEQTAGLPVAKALEVEARIFGEVTAGDVCKNLIRVFFLREAARKRTLDGWFEGRAGFRLPLEVKGASESGLKPALPRIRRVGVVGAGVMGSGIAHWLTAHGVDVVMRDVQPELVERGMTVVRGLFADAVRRGKMTDAEVNARLKRISVTTAWEGFADCDLVVEAIVEDIAAKRRLFSELAGVVAETTLLASNTSALPIGEIAGHVPNPGRTLGIHFFNPVSRMPLVELILGVRTSAESAERALSLVKALGKLPVICRSSPGFLVTRVLFFYLNAAVQLWERGAETATIDAALRDFGWPMGPLRLIDEVGVDVTDFIFGEMAHYFPDRFPRSTACGRLLAAGLKGRKNGASRGFYRYEGGREMVNDGETVALLLERATGGPGRESAEIVDGLMRVMVEEARRCLDEGVVKSAEDIDFALLSGAGFPAFRGGLMHWAASPPRNR